MLTKEQLVVKIHQTTNLIAIFKGDKAHKKELDISLKAYHMALDHVSLVEKIKPVLQYYADESNYQVPPDTARSDLNLLNIPHIETDTGQRARTLLVELQSFIDES